MIVLWCCSIVIERAANFGDKEGQVQGLVAQPSPAPVKCKRPKIKSLEQKACPPILEDRGPSRTMILNTGAIVFC